MILRQADIDPRSTPRLHQGRHVPEVSDAHVLVHLLEGFPGDGDALPAQAPVDRPPLHRDGGSGPLRLSRLRFPASAAEPVQHRAGRVQLVAADRRSWCRGTSDAMQLVNRDGRVGVQVDIPPATIYETEIQKATYQGSGPLRLRYDNSGRKRFPSVDSSWW